MTSFVTKMIAKKILGERLENKFGKEASSPSKRMVRVTAANREQDPYFEQVPATRLNDRPTKKMKRQKKALPPGISDHDGQVLTKVKRRAYRLDMSLFSFLGCRFGWGSVIGIIPA